MKFQPIYTTILIYAFAGYATAGSLTIPKVFVTGETARASEVNDNFTAVQTEVDDNNARINQNESAMSFKQERISGSCPAGQAIRVVNSDGSVSCETDTNTDTTYSAGSGLNLTGTEFSVDSVATQNRVSGSCPSGQSIRAINQDGTVSCEVDTDTDTNTTYSAGTGISLTGTVFSTDTNTIQNRVSGTCPAGQSINVINEDGTVSCEEDTDTDTDTTYSAGTGMTLTGTVFSTDAEAIQNRVSETCPEGESIRVIDDDGSVSCEVDTDTTYTAIADDGLNLDATTKDFTIDSAKIQMRVDSTDCAVGSSIRVINEDGSVVCQPYSVGVGSGLLLDPTTGEFTTDSSVLQQRPAIDITCGGDTVMIGIDIDGEPNCKADTDTDTTYSAGTGMQLDGTEFRPADGWVSVPVSAFQVNSPANCPVAMDYLTLILIFQGVTAPAGDCDVYAPVNLPHNAKPVQLDCQVRDVATGIDNSLKATLNRVGFNGTGDTAPTVETVLSTNSSDNVGYQVITSGVVGSTATVNNFSYTYNLKVEWSSTAFNNLAMNFYNLNGCRIAYTYP